jgi:hypothetical protein
MLPHFRCFLLRLDGERNVILHLGLHLLNFLNVKTLMPAAQSWGTANLRASGRSRGTSTVNHAKGLCSSQPVYLFSFLGSLRLKLLD